MNDKASFDQGLTVLQRIKEAQWGNPEVQSFLGNWGSIRDLTVALKAGRVAPDQVESLIAGRMNFGEPAGDFANEETPSNNGYPSGWSGFKPPIVQAQELNNRFGGKLDISHVEKLANEFKVIPSGMDGLEVHPKLSAITRLVKKPKVGWQPINIAMERLLVVMKEARPDFVDVTEGRIGPEYLRLHWRTLGAYLQLETLTPGDFLVLPTQTGILYRGRSVRRSRVLFHHQEFGLCPFAIGSIVLTHPERLTQGSLWIDCAGAEYAPDADGQFVSAPFWFFSSGQLRFYWSYDDLFGESCGSASSRLPE